MASHTVSALLLVLDLQREFGVCGSAQSLGAKRTPLRLDLFAHSLQSDVHQKGVVLFLVVRCPLTLHCLRRHSQTEFSEVVDHKVDRVHAVRKPLQLRPVPSIAVVAAVPVMAGRGTARQE